MHRWKLRLVRSLGRLSSVRRPHTRGLKRPLAGRLDFLVPLEVHVYKIEI